MFNAEVGKQIGQGAYATVAFGLHKESSKKVAIKIYDAWIQMISGEAIFLPTIQSERRMTTLTTSLNSITVYDLH